MSRLDALAIFLLVVGACNIVIGIVSVLTGGTQLGIVMIPAGGGAILLALAYRAHRRKTTDDGD